MDSRDDTPADETIRSRWANDGCEALRMSLARAPADIELLDDAPSTYDDERPTERERLTSTFHPQFVYPLYGEAQVIYGYDSLAIDLSFASGSLLPYLSVSYAAKPAPDSGIEADDVEGTLYSYLPADYVKQADTFAERVEADATAFRPIGELVGSYARRRKPPVKGKGKGRAVIVEEGAAAESDYEPCAIDDEGAIVYEAYATRMDTPGFRDYHRRMQIFVLLYIEGGSYLEEEDERWEFITLFEKRRRPDGTPTYHFVGYSSLYPFYFFPDKTRLRLAQFIVLPPYQQLGHGSALYRLIYEWALGRSDVAELTVEDPSEAFQDLRDRADLKRALADRTFVGQSAPVDPTWIATTRSRLKLADRQFSRVLEMALLIDLRARKSTPAEMRAYRLLVKERLYRYNHDVIGQMERTERRETLKSTYDGVVDEFDRLIEGLKPPS